MNRHGHCLSGAAEFELAGPIGQFRLLDQRGLGWFNAAPRAQRGFCRDCGASLFWQEEPGVIFVAAGSLDGPTGLDLAREIFTEDAGDYYGLGQAVTDPAAGESLSCRCLCGGVRFTVPGPAGAVTACHRSQCRRVSGHFAASFDVDETAVEYQARGDMATHGAAGGSTRGFCRTCGSSLWFRARNGDFSVEAGSVRGATGGYLARHIHMADKGDYYRLDDGVTEQSGAG